MGLHRKIPDFVLNVASNIPYAIALSNPEMLSTVESAVNLLKDYLLTSLTIAAGIETMVTFLIVLKTSLWVIKKLRK